MVRKPEQLLQFPVALFPPSLMGKKEANFILKQTNKLPCNVSPVLFLFKQILGDIMN